MAMTLSFPSRQETFAGHPHLARHVHDWQAECLDPADHRFEAGEAVIMDLEDDEAAVLTAEMAEDLNRRTEADLAALRDTFATPLPRDPLLPMIVAEPPGATMAECARACGPAFVALCAQMGWREIAIMPITRAPILIQHNESPQAAAAEAALEAAGLSRDHEGAISGAPRAVAPLFGPLFWIARCNASAPHILFNAAGSSVVGTFCKYVNLHLEAYDADERNRLAAALTASGFTEPPEGYCVERFADDGMIEGRRLDLG
ncbi:hypothetical protein [Roseitalea porphyridii]|uniref:Uncharacterized protein n=1 Tax=Roseitalea porphyridii TaxID=1852022 RepID=A0A4V1A440_9HYPH|nr:hypothetical protein [Roseitalea porphyridii]QBK31288.1 hypothetical protein E0E05_12160 [Roseitalea porphyridii]